MVAGRIFRVSTHDPEDHLDGWADHSRMQSHVGVPARPVSPLPQKEAGPDLFLGALAAAGWRLVRRDKRRYRH